MIQTRTVALPHGISLQCRETGVPGRPVLMFLHGFPEGAFIWDELLLHFARPENGGYHCIAPYLRGFGESSQPQAAEAYRAKHLVQDLIALISSVCTAGAVECLVAHDWGGAVAWNLANQQPQWLKRLTIINSPHPGALLRELQTNPAQQAASQYMHFLCRPDAEALLAENDFQRLFAFFNTPEGHAPVWLNEGVRTQYRALWSLGLTGACNYYRASPLRPPRADDRAALDVELPSSMLGVDAPVLVLWGMDDPALLPGLLQGLPDWAHRLRLRQIEHASHWVVHEQPERIAQELRDFLLLK